MSEEKIQVLVADDEDPLRMTVSAWLSDEGFDVEQAVDGLDAIKKVQSRDFDIALLDIKMPGANGLEVLRYIKKNSSLTEVVMMTGMSDITMAVEAMKLGAREYLSKPVDMERLVPQLKNIVRVRDNEDKIRRMQSEYTARLLYDLHNPIAGLRQSIGYLLKGMAGSLGDHQKELLGYMTTSIDKVINLLNNMMDLTKLEGGRIRLNKGIGNIGSLVETVTHEYRVLTQSTKITLDFYCEPDLPPLEYDSEKIEQVTQNLMRNALQNTPPQGAIVVQVRKVAIVLEEGQKPLDHIIVSIFNSGEGIPKAELQKLFDKYSDLNSEKASQNISSKLGLIIAQRIVEAHNGKIWATSEEGKGATFHYAVPIR